MPLQSSSFLKASHAYISTNSYTESQGCFLSEDQRTTSPEPRFDRQSGQLITRSASSSCTSLQPRANQASLLLTESGSPTTSITEPPNDLYHHLQLRCIYDIMVNLASLTSSQFSSHVIPALDSKPIEAFLNTLNNKPRYSQPCLVLR